MSIEIERRAVAAWLHRTRPAKVAYLAASYEKRRSMTQMIPDAKIDMQLVEALKAFCPADGSIVIEAGGNPVRLTRNKAGEVTVTEVVERAPEVRSRAPPPEIDAAEAKALGRQDFQDGVPIIDNPFPFGDPRRRHWVEGWRAAW